MWNFQEVLSADCARLKQTQYRPFKEVITPSVIFIKKKKQYNQKNLR